MTLELIVLTQFMALALGVPIASALAQPGGGKPFDRVWAAFSSLLIAIPPFVLALVLSYLLAVKWQVFPVTGWTPIADGLGDEPAQPAFLPALTLALGEIAIYSRLCGPT